MNTRHTKTKLLIGLSLLTAVLCATHARADDYVWKRCAEKQSPLLPCIKSGEFVIYMDTSVDISRRFFVVDPEGRTIYETDSLLFAKLAAERYMRERDEFK